MTKVRPALTFEAALTTIAAAIGWIAVTRICARSERTVRAWSEVEITEGIPMNRALALDVAYVAAGGDHAPFLGVYALRLQADTIAAQASSEDLARKTSTAIKEGGEAYAALVDASLPGATRADRVIAEREVVEAVGALTRTLAILRAGQRIGV